MGTRATAECEGWPGLRQVVTGVMLTPEVQTQRCVATERGDGGRRGLVSSWQPAWPRTRVLCQVLLFSQQSPLLLLHHASLLWAKQAPDAGGQRASAGCCQLGRLSAAERCLSKQTAQRATGRTEPVITGPAWPGTLPSAAWLGPGFTHRQLPTEGPLSQLGCGGAGPPLTGRQGRINSHVIKVHAVTTVD